MTDATHAKVIHVTAEGLEELKAELQELETVKLPAGIERLSIARSHGDLKENSEYHNAKEDLELIENRVSELKDALNHAQVVKHTKSKTKVGVGSLVKVSVKGKKATKKTFHIVGDFEANPTEGKISSSSPIGATLLGHKVGDEVEVKIPNGTVLYLIEEIK